MDGAGNVVVNYTYDAWGKPLSITGSMADTLGVQNPLRYRGYVYDQETGLYYLQSRYYDPEIGRFINADSLVTTGQGLLGNNMFAYCRNNPVKRKDVSGTDDISVQDANDDGTPLNDMGTNFRPGGSSIGDNGSSNGGNSSRGNGSGYAYSAPSGGGGVSSQVKVGDITVTFGHGGRHPTFTDISGLENAIANDVVTKPPTTGYRGQYDIAYGGTWFTYRYWTIEPMHIHVGTYFHRVSL